MKTTLQILEEARGLIESPATWTQGAYAKTAEGVQCDPNSPHAACFCLEGALMKVSRVKTIDDIYWLEAYKVILDQIPLSGGPIQFNDQNSHTEVLHVFDQAIAASRAQADQSA